jgi:sterol 24-C-methyltransferase
MFEGTTEQRVKDAADLARVYYTLSTDFYEYGWGTSFHFAPRVRGETINESILRYEHYLAGRLGLHAGMKVLDVGCGVGGPMRNIARFSGAHVTGITISKYQIERGEAHNRKERLESLVRFQEGDFNKMPFADNSFDAVYEIEACCHAADRRGPFGEAFRVLKPGALFGGYDWCLTDRYNASDANHRNLKLGIEKGDGIANLVSTSDLKAALTDVGFELLETEDRAPTADPETPWYKGLESGLSLQGFRNSRVGARLTHMLVRALETARLAPRGTVATHSMLRIAQSALPAAGRMGIFTPNYFFLARKPL